jgi:regulator of RNase E activity RraB
MKSALYVGINAYGHGSDLSGCVNDANDWAEILRTRGYDITSSDVITDADATKANIVAGLKEKIGRLKRGDAFIFQYSGHGTYVPDVNGDEVDGRDEAICPIDIFNGQYILDDELYDIFSERAVGSKVVFISDSCHSGTVNRFMLNPDLETPNVSKVRFLPPQQFLTKKDFPRVSPLLPPRKLKSSALLFAGCRDFEYSYDAWFGDRPNGAFTRVAIDAMSGLSELTSARQWYAKIREALPSQQYPQTPLLTGTSSQRAWKML